MLKRICVASVVVSEFANLGLEENTRLLFNSYVKDKPPTHAIIRAESIVRDRNKGKVRKQIPIKLFYFIHFVKNSTELWILAFCSFWGFSGALFPTKTISLYDILILLSFPDRYTICTQTYYHTGTGKVLIFQPFIRQTHSINLLYMYFHSAPFIPFSLSR